MAGSENQVDTIITNANVITIDPARPRAQALACSDGKLADLVILSEDPTAIDLMGIKDIPVERTIVGGKTVFEA